MDYFGEHCWLRPLKVKTRQGQTIAASDMAVAIRQARDGVHRDAVTALSGTVLAMVLPLDGYPSIRRCHHSITLSARRSMLCGTVMPSALAVFRLITSSNFVACTTGSSAGFAPFRILST